MATAPTAYVPSVRARRLASTLRMMRERALLSQRMAAARLDWSPAKIGHIETCVRRVAVPDVVKLLDLYGVAGPEREETLAVARDAERRSWWVQYPDVLNGGAYIALEDAASEVWEWQPQVMPGLLQTVEYARRIIQTAGVFTPDQVERRVDARLLRQKLLSRADAPQLKVVLDEAVLERPILPRAEWRDQLRRLVHEQERANVTVQILPKTAGAHAGMEGPFIVLQFAEVADPPVGYCEGRFGAVYLESPQKVAECTVAFGRLSDIALSQQESAALIETAAMR